jgi:uncharacterized protein (TIGR02594 family)
MNLRAIQLLVFLYFSVNFGRANCSISYLQDADSSKIDSAEVNEYWRYCGDPFLMDLACVGDIHDSILEIPIINEALKYYGLRDIEGSLHEQRVLEFFKSMGYYSVNEDEVSWCSVFIGSCAKNIGFEYTKLATARSWLNIGERISQPVPGDIVVFWRENPNSWKGHVSIYLGQNPETNEVYALGGNQNDEVCILTYDLDTVLGFRRLNPKLK